MFNVLAYLYETYYRPDTCPDGAVLAKKLSAIGFEKSEIFSALDWLSGLAKTTEQYVEQHDFSQSTRIYAQQEIDLLGTDAIGFISTLEHARAIDCVQREIIIERALAVQESPISLEKLRIIVSIVLWSQGKGANIFMFAELLLSNNIKARPAH